MTSDKHQRAKTDLLRELENLRAQLDDPDNAELSEDDIPILLDKVEKAVADTPNLDELAEEGLEPEEVQALREAYQQATDDLQEREARLLQQAAQHLREDRESIAAITGNAWESEKAPEPLPGQQSLFAGTGAAEEEEVDTEPQTQAEPPQTSAASDSMPKTPQRPKALGENPFLPKHIRDRLEERRKALQDDITQAASFFPKSDMEASSTEAPKVPLTARSAGRDHQALVDQLVAEYLPRIEADLRSRLMRKLQQDDHKSNSDPS